MADYYPPSDRFGDYNANVIQGVIGGIPTRSGGNVFLVTDYGWSTGGSASSNASAFAAALAASAEGDIIEFPAGTSQITTLYVPYDKPNRTLRGAGMTSTILQTNSSTGISIGNSPAYGSGNPTAVITGMTAGSATVTVADGSALPTPTTENTYRIAKIFLQNETTTPVISVYGYESVRSPTVVLKARSGNTLTLSQPLPSNFPYGSSGAVIELAFPVAFNTTGIGVEDLTVDCSPSGGSTIFGIAYSMSYGCWTKGVKVREQGNYGIFVSDSSNYEMRECRIEASYGGGTSHAGFVCSEMSYSLIEDNIIYDNGPDIEVNFASMSNVFGYNYLGFMLNVNHGPHNSFNLYEGNTYYFKQTDGYFGGNSEDTDFREWCRAGDVFLIQNRFSRNRNVIGNICGIVGNTYATDGTELWGKPNIGNNNSVGTAEPSTGDWWLDSTSGVTKSWTGTLSTRTSNTAGVVTLDSGQAADFVACLAEAAGSQRGLFSTTAQPYHGFLQVTSVVGNDVTFTTGSGSNPVQGTPVVFRPSPSGFQEFDLDVASTTIRKANWYVITGDIPAGESIGAFTLPASYYRATKPAWFGELAWPAYDSFNPGTPSEVNIPAGWRRVNGNTDYLTPTTVSTPSFGPGAGTYTSAQSVSISTVTSGATIRYTIDGSTPTSSFGTIYTGAILISSTTTLKAIAYNGVLSDSTVRTGVFTINSTPQIGNVTVNGPLTATTVTLAG